MNKDTTLSSLSEFWVAFHAEWARCIEQSHYFHYGTASGKFKAKSEDLDRALEEIPSWNQQQSQDARDRIRSAIADLLEKDSLPSTITNRFQVLTQYGIGGSSLYRHRDLWHPKYLKKELQTETSFASVPSLFPSDGSNCNSGNDSSDLNSSYQEGVGRNSDSSQTDSEDEQRISVALAALSAKQVDRIQGFLASRDAILIAEAVSWVQIALEMDLQRDPLYLVITNRIKQLGWCDSQTSAQLLDRFATADISHLSDIELLRWCLEVCKASPS